MNLLKIIAVSKMKKLNFAVLFAALIAMFSFSSCLDTMEDDGTRTGNYFVKVVSMMGVTYFQDVQGNKFSPSTPLTDVKSDMALVNLTYNENDMQTNGGYTTVTVNGIVYIDPVVAVTKPETPTWNAPIATLEGDYVKMGFWDANTLIVPVYFYYDASSEDKLTEELAKHQFEFYVVEDDSKYAEGTLSIALRHRVNDAGEKPTRNKLGSAYKYINLSAPLMQYKQKYGSAPKQIIVDIEQNQMSDSYTEGSLMKKEYTIEYQFQDEK